MQNPPPGKQDAILFIPFRYLAGAGDELTPYELSVMQSVPEAAADFLDTSRKCALYPGQLNISRESDGWGCVVISPVTVRQGRVTSLHFYSHYCRDAVRSLRCFMEMGFRSIPRVYIALPGDFLSSTAIIRAAREELEYAEGIPAFLLQKPRFRTEKFHFTQPISVSAVIGSTYAGCPELGILPLRSRRRSPTQNTHGDHADEEYAFQRVC